MTEIKTPVITPETLDNAYSYDEYRALTDRLLQQGKTTGENHSEVMLHYTRMNVHRMNRLDKHSKLSDELLSRLHNTERSVIWLVLTEAWCGDAAQSLPVIRKMADQSRQIRTRYILRDEHPEIIDHFLTNGRSRSIPKLICLDSRTQDVLGSWGPRPAKGQLLFEALRNQTGISSREVAERMHKWYADDKTESLQNDFLFLLNEWEKT